MQLKFGAYFFNFFRIVWMEQLLGFFFLAFIIRQLSFVIRYLQSLTFLGHARNSEGHSF